MEELFNRFSITEIILFIVLFALAIKGIIDFFDWAHKRLKEKFDKENINNETKNIIDKKFEEDEKRIKKLEDSQIEIIETLEKVNEKIDMLIDSDKDDIKADLTRIHHFYCYTQKWIDDYTLECCERRFSHYEKEGGNTFIEGFMKELRTLPKKPPESHTDALPALII